MEDVSLGMPVGGYLDDINSCRKICPLNRTSSADLDPELCSNRQIAEQCSFIHCLFHLTIDVM